MQLDVLGVLQERSSMKKYVMEDDSQGPSSSGVGVLARPP